jgi:NADH dehydrogenase FAD-containing subunit
MDEFKKDGIEVLLKTSVKEIRRNEKDQSEVELSNGEVRQFGLMVWSTGVQTLPFIKELDCPHDEPSGRLLTNDKLQVIG